jgi:hypothetical protein
MHNCKATIDRVTELLLDRPNAHPDDLLSKELLRCAECRTEFDALKQTLRLTSELIERTGPPKSYWNRYHEKLRQRLDNVGIHHVVSHERTLFARFFGSSIRIPVPVGLALIFLFAVALLFATRVSQKEVTVTQKVSVPVPYEVPVVQEKIVTRVLYRDRITRRTERPTVDSAVAKSVKNQNEARPAALIGFKPLDEVKLTVIKGGSPNEK